MSVPSWRRTTSKLDAFFEAVKLRHIVMTMVARNFGLKIPDQCERLVSSQLRESYPELKAFFDRVDEYQDEAERQNLLREYDQGIVENARQNLMRFCTNMVSSIAGANEILCKIPKEFEQRIIVTDQAISAVADIRQEVLFIEEYFDIDLNRFMEYSEQLDNVKGYLYNWKKATVRDYDEFLHPEKKAERMAKERAKPKRKTK